MGYYIRQALRAFIADVRAWNRPYEPPARDPRGIGRHFANVGLRLSAAAEAFAREHPEIPAHA